MNEAVSLPLSAESANPAAFTGVRGDFRRLIIRGALLELITLGFYRFWLATDTQRHLWSHTSVGGDAPEYTGTAKELLIGFLIALAILAPVYLAYFFVGLEAELYQDFASIPLVLFFYLFYQFAIYRARRYRLTRTVWRGVRFWMKGSGWVYALQAGLWMLLVIITLGLAQPWRQAALERYKMKNSYYGDLAGRFDGTGWGLAKQIWPLWIPLVLPIGFVVLASIYYESFVIGLILYEPRTIGLIVLVLLIVVLVFLIAFPFAYAAYKAAEWAWWMSGIRFADIRMESKLSISAFIALYGKVIGWTFLLLAVLSVWFTGVIVGASAAIGDGIGEAEGDLAILQHPVVLMGSALGYVLCALAFGIVVRMYLRRDLWARVVASTVIYNMSAADSVTGRGVAANALGEGLADGLHIGGF